MVDTHNGEAFIGGAALLDLIPEIPVGATRILDFGCGNGSTLMRLKKEWGCTELYGVDIRESYEAELNEKRDEAWITDISVQYPYFPANKIIAICKREATITVPEPIVVEALEERRKRLSKR